MVPRRGLHCPSAIKGLARSGEPDRLARFRGFTWRSFPLAPRLTPRGACRDRARCRKISRGFSGSTIRSNESVADAQPDSVDGATKRAVFGANLDAIFGASSAAAQAQVAAAGPGLARKHRTVPNVQAYGPAARGASDCLACGRRQGRGQVSSRKRSATRLSAAMSVLWVGTVRVEHPRARFARDYWRPETVRLARRQTPSDLPHPATVHVKRPP